LISGYGNLQPWDETDRFANQALPFLEDNEELLLGVISQVVNAAAHAGSIEGMKRWLGKMKEVGNNYGRFSQEALLIRVTEADALKVLKKFEDSEVSMQSGELIARKFSSMEERTIEGLMYAAGLWAAGVHGTTDPLAGIIENATFSARLLDNAMFLLTWAEFLLFEGKETRALGNVRKALDIVKANDPNEFVKGLYLGKVNELVKKYPNSSNALQVLTNGV